jgi:hypothetical protein
MQSRGLTLSQAGKSQPFAHPRRFFWFILLSFYPVDDGFWANGAHEVAQIPKNVWEYWLILLNIGCGRAEQGLFRHANQPLSAPVR